MCVTITYNFCRHAKFTHHVIKKQACSVKRCDFSCAWYANHVLREFAHYDQNRIKTTCSQGQVGYKI